MEEWLEQFTQSKGLKQPKNGIGKFTAELGNQEQLRSARYEKNLNESITFWPPLAKTPSSRTERAEEDKDIDYNNDDDDCRSITAKPTYIKKEKDISRLPEI